MLGHHSHSRWHFPDYCKRNSIAMVGDTCRHYSKRVVYVSFLFALSVCDGMAHSNVTYIDQGVRSASYNIDPGDCLIVGVDFAKGSEKHNGIQINIWADNPDYPLYAALSVPFYGDIPLLNKPSIFERCDGGRFSIDACWEDSKSVTSAGFKTDRCYASSFVAKMVIDLPRWERTLQRGKSVEQIFVPSNMNECVAQTGLYYLYIKHANAKKTASISLKVQNKVFPDGCQSSGGSFLLSFFLYSILLIFILSLMFGASRCFLKLCLHESTIHSQQNQQPRRIQSRVGTAELSSVPIVAVSTHGISQNHIPTVTARFIQDDSGYLVAEPISSDRYGSMAVGTTIYL